MNNTYGFKDETQHGKSPVVSLMPVLPEPVDERLDARSINMLERAKAFTCTTPEEYEVGDKVVSECAALVKRIKEIHDPICKATNVAHKTATGARKDLIDPIERASKMIDNTLGNYKMQHDRKVAAEKKVLEDEAREASERVCLEQAEELERANAPKELVDAVLEMGTESVQVEKPQTPELYSKNSRTPDWDIEILDKELVPDYYKTVNEGAIRADVKSRKGNITIPGVRIFDTFKTRRKAL